MFTAQTHNPNKASTRTEAVRVDAGRERKEEHEHNPIWQSLALGSLRLQPKLSISQPGDADELEADQIADRVMRMPATQSACSCSHSNQLSAKVQRKCASCEEEEERVQRKSRSAETVAGANVDHALSSQGRPLDIGTRSFMESRFAHDFSKVRVHDDSPSATSAESIQAKAYTIGPNIVFGAGMYQPGTNDGRRLLAHELAHTVQQNASGPRVRRDTDDFDVTQVQPDPEERTEGMSDRFFFEKDQSTFRKGEPAEEAELKRLGEWANANSGKHVRLIGRASQEESETNKKLASDRVATVRSVLESGGVIVDGDGIDTKFEQRPVDYRFYRSVEIVAGTPTCNKFTKAQQKQDRSDCEAAFKDAHGRATKIVNAAMARLRPKTEPPLPATQTQTQTQPSTPAPPRDSRDTVLKNHFEGIPRETLLPLFESIATRLRQVGPKGGHSCNHRCKSGCERAASAGAGDPLTLCAPFYISDFTGALSVDLRVFAVLHETTHSAVIKGSKPRKSVGIDIAYSSTRLFGVLTGDEALRNADSFVMTLLLLAEDAGDAPATITARESAPADARQLTTPATEKVDRNLTARRALGFAESWLNYASFWAPDLYDYLNASLKSWSDLNSLGHFMLELWAAPFQLNHPGNKGIERKFLDRIKPFQTAVAVRGFTAPVTTRHATQEDRTRVAGIYDRYHRMLKSLDRALTIDKAATGDGWWSTDSGLPGVGTNVELADSFFALSPVEQARHIIRLMARAMNDIPKTWEESYVEGADGVHQFRNLGP